MKRICTVLLVFLFVLSLTACGGNAPAAADPEEALSQAEPNTSFRVGFGRADVTPKESVPMDSYGNPLQRMSKGRYSNLYLNVLAVDDGENQLLLMTIDHTWFNKALSETIRSKITAKYGIPDDHILMQGTHTHAGPATGEISSPAMTRNNQETCDKALVAVGEALEDLKPAEIFVGDVMTEGMNFVRRYMMDDGSLTGDAYAGTGTAIVGHETEADGEVQLMKFVRDGGEDILIVNFQTHPHLEGESLNLSAQIPGAIRDAVEQQFKNKCIYWQGAAGNLNSQSRIEEEKRFESSNTGRIEYGTVMANYISTVYDSMEKVASGPIQVEHRTVTCQVYHDSMELVEVAKQVHEIFTATNNSSKAMEVGRSHGITSVHHARAVVDRSKMDLTKDIPVAAFSFGDVSGIVVPYEMFDTNGMQIKAQTPFTKTLIFGYANPGSFSYIPNEEAFENSGYEVLMCRYVKGTAEQFVGVYLDMLGELKK